MKKIAFLFISIIIYYFYKNILYLTDIYNRVASPILSTQQVNWKSNTNINNYNVNNNKINNNNLPNIILIIADDLGINDLSPIYTPNINSIYKNGAIFINTYAGQAMCAPSRAAIYTGLFPTNIGAEFTPFPKELILLSYFLKKNNRIPNIVNIKNLKEVASMEDLALPLNYSLLSNVLLEQGYYNYFLGKWHLGERKGYTPLDRGYNESLSFLQGASMYENSKNKSIVSYINQDSTFDKLMNIFLPFAISHNNGPKFKPNEYMTDYLSNNALKIIEINENATLPFFMTIAYNAPHNPYQALISDYESPDMSKIVNHNERVYYSMIKALDRGVGKILDTLRKTNQYDNTLIIFTSDNGGAYYSKIKNTNKPYRGFKSTYFEGGIKVPLFIQYPKLIPKNKVYHKLTHHVDIFYTILNILNITTHNKLDGVNLFDNKQKHKTIFWRVGNYLCIRHDNIKLILSERLKKVWLYDLQLDSTEQHNLLENINVENINNIKYYKNMPYIFDISTKLYRLLIKKNSTAKAPLWQPILETPIPIDNTIIKNGRDKYIYWSN